MRPVQKGAEPPALTEWKALECADWQPCYASLQNPEKRILHESLLIEQGWTCCYCGREIKLCSSHIEHFRPQKAYPSLSLDYLNLFASCLREVEAVMPTCCGHGKGEWFNETTAISPLEADCDTHFSYDISGQISPYTDAAAVMCNVLKLNQPLLKAGRQEALGAIFTEEILISADDGKLAEIIADFQAPGLDGALPSYFQAVIRFAESLRP